MSPNSTRRRGFALVLAGAVSLQPLIMTPALAGAKTTKKTVRKTTKKTTKKPTTTKKGGPTTTTSVTAATGAPPPSSTVAGATSTVAGGSPASTAPGATPTPSTTGGPTTIATTGQGLYAQKCALCHGPNAEGFAPAHGLAKGEMAKTFPNVQEAYAFVRAGAPAKDTPYGDPARPGGQRVSVGEMPSWAPNQLTDEQIRLIVDYLRTI